MGQTVLITRPDHETTTRYLFYWSQEIISCAQKKGNKVIDLAKKRANKREFVSVLNKTKPSLVILNGHGSEDTVTGFDNEPLLTIGDGEELLSHKITFARACSCGRKLGPAIIRAGGKTFIGYDDEFVFVIDEKYVSRPLADKAAALFLKASNQVALSLLKGHSSAESNLRSKEMYKKVAQKYLTSEAIKEQASLVPYLVWDWKHQICLGDHAARFTH